MSTDASLRINRRVSDSTSRGTETVAIRSVNFRTTPPSSPQPVEVPDDVVYVGDVYDADELGVQHLAEHDTLPAAGRRPQRAGDRIGTGTRYTASTQTPADTIISISQTGGSATDNQFVTDGYVFVPNSKVVLSGGANTNYRLRLSAGVVASSVELDYQQLPSLSDNWFLGVLDEPIQRQVDLFVAVTRTQRSAHRLAGDHGGEHRRELCHQRLDGRPERRQGDEDDGPHHDRSDGHDHDRSDDHDHDRSDGHDHHGSDGHHDHDAGADERSLQHDRAEPHRQLR